MTPGTSLLEIDHVTKEYPLSSGSVVALDDLCVSVPEGQLVSILGPSGCGKTTLLEVVAGLRPTTKGEVRIKGKPVSGPSPSIGIVFQEPSTLPWRTVQANIAFGLEMSHRPKDEVRRRTEEMIEFVGLHGFERAYPHQLSGGMRQRVSIARALALQPDVIVMDEPFGALDEQTRLRLGLELLAIARQFGTTILLVTHSIQEAALLSDAVVVLSARPGRVKETFDVPLPRERDLSTLTHADFAGFSQQLWSCMVDVQDWPGATALAAGGRT